MTTRDDTPDLGDEMDRNIGQNLKRMREEKGISQAELARLATAAGLRGFHQTTIARVEAGQRSLRAAEALAVARVLETSLDWLAESTENTTLRSHLNHVNEAAERYRSATRGVLTARALAAGFLDRHVPYDGTETLHRESLLQSGLDPRLYERIENRLLASSPELMLQTALIHEVKSPPAEYGVNPDRGHRVRYLLREYTEGAQHGEHQTEA